jgi:hypothetical protein
MEIAMRLPWSVSMPPMMAPKRAPPAVDFSASGPGDEGALKRAGLKCLGCGMEFEHE